MKIPWYSFLEGKIDSDFNSFLDLSYLYYNTTFLCVDLSNIHFERIFRLHDLGDPFGNPKSRLPPKQRLWCLSLHSGKQGILVSDFRSSQLFCR